MGYEHPVQASGDDIEFSTGSNTFTTLRELLGYARDPTDFTRMEDYRPRT